QSGEGVARARARHARALPGLSRRRPSCRSRRLRLLRAHGGGLGRVLSGRARGDGRRPTGDRPPRRRAPGDRRARRDRVPDRRRSTGERRAGARNHPGGSGARRGDGPRGPRPGGGMLQRRAIGRHGGARVRRDLVRILQLVSCRGWSSDAYWAARTTRELARRGHTVTLACLAGKESRVLDGMRRESVEPITTLAFASGVHPGKDGRDLVRLRGLLEGADIVHVHRGKEHWLAAVANRLMARRRDLVRTRHIALAVRPHAANRWLYRRATALVVTVTEAIRGQFVAAGLVDGDRVVALHGGADAERYRPLPRDPAMHRHLGGPPGPPLVGMVAGLRVMKGHAIVVEAAARLAARGIRPHFAFVGRGNVEKMVRATIERAGLAAQFSIVGFVADLPAALPPPHV